MGAWQAGKAYWVDITDEGILQAIDAACEVGVSAFDTAEAYGEGYSERILGKALAKRRDKVQLLSKVFSNHLRYDQVLKACDRSLKNLNSDYLDLYQIHWPSGSWGSERVPIAETMQALNELKEVGKIKAIGVSNFSLAQLQEACEFGQIDSIQPPYSIFWRHIEREIMPFCLENGISILAYSPMAQGFLTGRFQANHKFAEGDNRNKNKLFDHKVFPKVQTAVAALREIAASNNITLPQLALAWVTSHERSAAIAGVRNAAQIRDNAQAGEVVLSKEDLEKIDVVTMPVFEQFLDDPVPWIWNP